MILTDNLNDSEDQSQYYISLVKSSIENSGHGSETAERAAEAGNYFLLNKDHERAAVYLTQAHEIYSKRVEKSNKKRLKVAQNLSVAYYYLSKYKKAEKLAKYVLEENRKLDNNDVKILSSLTNLGYIYYYANKYNKSLKYFQEAQQLSSRTLGEYNTKTLSLTLKIADVYYWNNEYSESIDHLQTFLTKYLEIENPDTETIGNAYVKLADSYQWTAGNTENTLYYYKKALIIYQNIYGEDHKTTVDVLFEISQVYHETLKNYEEALKYLTLFLQHSKNTLDKNHPKVLRSVFRMAQLYYVHLKKPEASERIIKQMIALIESLGDEATKKTNDLKVDFTLLLVEVYLTLLRIEDAQNLIVDVQHWYSENCDPNDKRSNKINFLLEKLEISDQIDPLVPLENNIGPYLKFIKKYLDEPLSKRRVRIFISSTFRDMMAEREHLIKTVFPKLKSLCKERGIDFSAVDLRWGVTEEDVEQGRVIQICLDEIDRSRPYFIGILGERYGWVPSADSFTNYDRIVHNYDWIKGDFEKGLSITEMEIQYGVLRNPDMKGNAFFYLRDEALTPPEEDFKETKGSELHQKLKHLKKHLRGQNEFPVIDFSSIDQLGNAIYNDLLAAVFDENDLEIKENTTEQKLIEQLGFLKLNTDFYVGQPLLDQQFSGLLTGKSNKILIYGEQGTGKTMFISNWVNHNQDLFDRFLPFIYFVGLGSDGAHIDKLLSQLFKPLHEVFPGSEKYHENTPNPAEAVSRIFDSIPSTDSILLIIDGIEKLQQNKMFGDLYWLPKSIPNHVKIVFTTNDKRLRDNLIGREFDCITFSDLDESSQRIFISDYLLKFGKKLSPNVIEKIIKSPLSNNPLSLKLLVDELRIFGSFEELEAHLDGYLEANNTQELFSKMLARLEHDYEVKAPGLVGDILSAIQTSKKGLNEDDILAICGTAKLFWSPIYSSLENYLVHNKDLLSINNVFLEEAIKERYLNYEKLIVSRHGELADYFAQHSDRNRTLVEYGYHLFHANKLNELSEFIVDIEVFTKLYYLDSIELINYFNVLETAFDMVDAFKKSVLKYETNPNHNPTTLSKVLTRIANLFGFKGANEKSIWFLEKLEELNAVNKDASTTSKAEVLLDLANSSRRKKAYDDAIEQYQQAIAILDQNPGYKPIKKAMAFHGLSEVYIAMEEYNQAEDYEFQSIEHFRKSVGNENAALIGGYSNLSLIESIRGNIAKSLEYMDSALDNAYQFMGKEHFIVAQLLFQKAKIIEEKRPANVLEEVMHLLSQALKIQIKNLGSKDIQTLSTVISMADLLLESSHFDDAKKILLEYRPHSEEGLGADHQVTNAILSMLLRTEIEIGLEEIINENNDEGLDRLFNNLEECFSILGKEHPLTQSNLKILIDLAKKYGEDETAEELSKDLI